MDQHPSREQLRRYLDGHLDEAETRNIEQHLAVCDEVCQQVVVSIADSAAAESTRVWGDEDTVTVKDSPRLPPPDVNVPGYEILETLRQSEVEVLCKARETDANRLVALTVFLHTDAADKNRIRAEAESMARLVEPTFVQLLAVGEHKGQPFRAMEWCEGGSLSAKVKGNPQPVDHAATTVETLVRAIQTGHDMQIVHRDLTPDNVLFAADGSVKVAGFGKMIDPTWVAFPGGIRGNPSYMAPEQFRTVPSSQGPAVDIYALGAILYQMLTGRPPFQSTSPMDTMHQVLEEEPIAPSRLNASVPSGLETICVKCLEKQPQRRYAAASDLAEDLRRFQAGEAIKAQPPGKLELGWRWVRRHRTAAGVMGGALLLAVGLVAFGAWYQQEMANFALDQAVQSARVEHQKSLDESRIRTALEQAQSTRDELRSTLKKKGGVFEMLHRQEEWQQRIENARSVLRRARGLIQTSPEQLDKELLKQASTLELLLNQDDWDRQVANRLDRIQTERVTRGDDLFAAAEYAMTYSDAIGLRGRTSHADVAARVAASNISEQFIYGLDCWALIEFQHSRNMSLIDRLHAITRQAAPDPPWGDRLRQLKLWQDEKALEELIKDAPLERLSPQMVDFVGLLLWRNPARQESWLRRAQAQAPTDFWLKVRLANAIARTSPQEAVAYCWGAIAVQPERCAPAWYCLGDVLYEQRKLPEAIAAYRNGMRLSSMQSTKYRYHAACAAVLVGTGQGKPAGKMSAEELGKLRLQAIEWLRADLAVWAGKIRMARGDAVRDVKNGLTRWLTDASLSAVRDDIALARLPPTERQAWQKLWADVRTLEK